jgi:tRNA(Leu) C34 or U34 (ribose-2'-O)-methylase TrmL
VSIAEGDTGPRRATSCDSPQLPSANVVAPVAAHNHELRKDEGVDDTQRPSSDQGPLHGVGPWVGEKPTDPRYDPVLLERGDTRNVLDQFRYWTIEAIVAELDSRRNPFHVAIENWQHDMNIGSIVRSANAFGAQTVHIIGRRRWNKRGAMVTDRYQHVLHHDTVADFVTWSTEHELPIIAIDNVQGSVIIETFAMPKKCVLLFGQEGPGLSDEALDAATAIVEISQFGSTRSINASAAAAVAMHCWVTQHVQF